VDGATGTSVATAGGEVPAHTRDTGGGVLPLEGWWSSSRLLLLPLLLLLLLALQLFQQSGLFLLRLPGNDDLYFSGPGDPFAKVGLTAGLQEEWGLTHRVWASMVWLGALFILD